MKYIKYIKNGIMVGVFLLPVVANAQTPQPDSIDVGVKVVVEGVFDISLIEVFDYDPDNPGNVTPSADDTVDYFNRTPGTYTVGSTEGTYAINIQVSNNAAPTYQLEIRGTGDFSGPGGSFSLSNLEWAFDGDPGAQTWTPFTTTYITIATGGREQTNYYLDYRLTIPWDVPGESDYRTVTRFLLISNP